MIYPSITKIRSFIAVAEQASFRKASETLHLSQSAISMHIRELEALFKVPLLSRTTRSVRVTREGQHFLIRVKRALSELESAFLELKDEAALRRGQVTVACVPTVASSILPTVLAVFSERYAGVKVHVVDDVSATIGNRVVSLEADFGIGPRPVQNLDLSFEPLVQDHFIAVFPHTHELAGRATVRMKELLKYPFVALAPRTNVRMILDDVLAKMGRTLEPAYEPSHHYTLGAMVESGLGVTAIPSMSLSLVGHPRLRSARIIDPKISREIGIMRRRDNVLSPAAAEFLETTRAVFAASAPDDGRRLRRHVPKKPPAAAHSK